MFTLKGDTVRPSSSRRGRRGQAAVVNDIGKNSAARPAPPSEEIQETTEIDVGNYPFSIVISVVAQLITATTTQHLNGKRLADACSVALSLKLNQSWHYHHRCDVFGLDI